jgi:transcription antitermination factor NusG
LAVGVEKAMPILREQISLYPENLLNGFSLDEENAERHWWAVYTKPRQEKAVTRQLLAQDTPFYLPLTRSNHYYRGRRRTSYTPVFGSYLFVFGTDYERVDALTTNRILRTLLVKDREQLLDDLRNLRGLVESGVPVRLETQLEPGDRVRVKSGMLRGVEGTILRRDGTTRLLVAVNFFQQGASAEIDDFMVERI